MPRRWGPDRAARSRPLPLLTFALWGLLGRHIMTELVMYRRGPERQPGAARPDLMNVAMLPYAQPFKHLCSPFPGLVDPLGEVFQGLGAFLEPPLGHRSAGRAEQVPGPDRAVPAAEPVQALLLLIQLGQRQLALGDLTGQLGLLFAAVGQELAPFGLALGGEQRLQLGRAG